MMLNIENLKQIFPKRNSTASVPNSTTCVCERFLYSHDRSAYSAAGNICGLILGNINSSQNVEIGTKAAQSFSENTQMGFSSQCDILKWHCMNTWVPAAAVMGGRLNFAQQLQSVKTSNETGSLLKLLVVIAFIHNFYPTAAAAMNIRHISMKDI